MGLQVLDHTAARMAPLHERFYYADDVDDLLARIRAAVEAMHDAENVVLEEGELEYYAERDNCYADARAALGALLSQGVTDG